MLKNKKTLLIIVFALMAVIVSGSQYSIYCYFNKLTISIWISITVSLCAVAFIFFVIALLKAEKQKKEKKE